MVEFSSDARMFDPKEIYNSLGMQEIAAELLRIDDQCFEAFQLRFLNARSRLIVFIGLKGTVTVNNAFLNTDLSYRAFHVMTRRLRDKGMIKMQIDENDRRVKHLSLTDAVLDFATWLK